MEQYVSDKPNNFRTELGAAIFRNKYALTTDETWLQRCQAVVDDVCGTRGGTTHPLMSSDERKELVNLMHRFKFLPGGRYLYYSGRGVSFYSNCMMYKAEEDTRQEWGRLIHSCSDALMSGAGVGIDYSILRHRGSLLRRTGGIASGPLPLAHAINEYGRGVQQGGCLPEDTLVHTDKGLVKIQEVEVGDLALTFDGMKKVEAVLDQGIQNTVTIKNQTGNFVCTGNHRIAVLTTILGDYEWKEAKNLVPGDRMVFMNTPISGGDTAYPEYKYGVDSKMSTTCVDINIPVLSTEQAWLLGYLHGNGYVWGPEGFKGRVSFSVPHTSPDVAERVTNALEDFGANVIRHDGCGACWNIASHSVQLADFFAQFKLPNTTITVPDCILRGSEDVRAAYVAGCLDSDGSVNTHPVVISTSVYPEFLKQLRAVCSSLGFATRLRLTRPAKGKWQALYSLSVSAKKQTARFDEVVAKYSNKTPVHRAGPQNAYTFEGQMVWESGLKPNITNQARKIPVTVEMVEAGIGDLKFTPVKVLAIESGPMVHTYDLTIAERNEFVAEGFLVHNSRRSAIFGSLNWQHGDAPDWLKVKDWANQKITGTDITFAEAKRNDFDAKAPLDFTNISLNYDNQFLSAVTSQSNKPYSTAADFAAWSEMIEKVALPPLFIENVRMAMYNGEPGFSFNFFTRERETLRNACTEICSEDDSDVCNLGSVNMAACATIKEFALAVELGAKFLVCGTIRGELPDEKVRRVREKNRRLGLGLMGVHEWLLQRGHNYAMNDDLREWLQVYKSVSETAANEHCDRFFLNRPVAYRALAPNGTIGTLAGSSTSSEPIFAVAYKRRYIEGNRETGVEKRRYQYYVDSAAQDLMNRYGLAPEKIESALDLAKDPERRIAFQADVQDYVDMAISSTLNLPEWGSEWNNDDKVVEFARIIAKYAPRLRGLTMYPDGARGGQPLTSVPLEEAQTMGTGIVFEENSERACKSGVCGI